MPELLPDQLNINIPGAWNRAILQPDWLHRHFPDLSDETEGYQVQFQQGIGALGLIRFIFKQVIIEPAANRLILRPRDIGDQNLEYVGELGFGIIEKLEHTPIFGVGHNIHYEVKEDETFAIKQFINDEDLNVFYESIKLSKRTNFYRHTFSFENHDLKITYDENRPKPQISFNFHYDVSNLTREKKQHIFHSFLTNFKHAEQFVTKLIRTDDGNLS